MNREIKFRAWDKKAKQYTNNVNVNFMCGAVNSESNKVIFQRYCFEQFTGLKDRNEKEIYEGDVVNVVNEDDELLKCIDVISRVYFCDGMFVIDENEFQIPLYETFNREYGCQVIGNIHENPELLEGKG